MMTEITTKELTALSDLLAMEQNLVAKYKACAQQTNDMTLKNRYEEIAARHQDHFNRLYSNLK